MNGLFFYLAAVLGSLIALAPWIWRRGDVSSRQIASFLSVCVIWLGTAPNILGPLPPATSGIEPNNEAGPHLPLAETSVKAGEQTFPDKFFDGARSPSPRTPGAMAYAAPELGLRDTSRTEAGPLLGIDGWTAIYDISAHTVYLPDGSELEAHSGLGAKLDNPRFVHERMRGPTPPHLYELALREKPFHGVRALRLKPVGRGETFGRTGLLAHTYMLGPNGHSNGCVVFRDYAAFLRAFQNGEVRRLVVVSHID